MKLKLFIPIILILIIGAIGVGVVVMGRSGTGPLADMLSSDDGSGESADTTAVESLEPGLPQPTTTPELHLVKVVVAKIDLPVGEELLPDLLEVEFRPETNVALMGQYTVGDPEELYGQFARVRIAKGQAILKPMIAFQPDEIAEFGSDLSLYLNQGTVAIAFPINKFSGAAYALRPGDLVDALMTMKFVDIDPEFHTSLPNLINRVFNPDLLAGKVFLFDDSATYGRLEFIPLIGQTAAIIPANPFNISTEEGTVNIPRPISRRVTQLTVQQAEVVWVGNWHGPLSEQGTDDEPIAIAEDVGEGFAIDLGSIGGDGEDAVEESEVKSSAYSDAEATPLPVRFDQTPDIVILSVFPQDALILKWAMDRGIDVDLVLRAQGDVAIFDTTNVSLPQIVDYSGWVLSQDENNLLDVSPHPEDVERPELAPLSIP